MGTLVLLVEYDYGGVYGEGKVLGTFDKVSKANDWCLSNLHTDTVMNFVDTEHCPIQSVYFKETIGIVHTDCKLTLIESLTRLGLVRMAMEEEETLLDLLQARDSIADDLTADDDVRTTLIIKDVARSKIYLDFNNWGISLLEDGRWFFEDTKGLYGS